MKRVYAAFDHLFIGFDIETDIPSAAYSKRDEDMIFYVMDENATESDFHAADKQLTEQHTQYNYQQSGEFFACQHQFYFDDENCRERMSELIDDLKEIILDPDFANNVKEYRL